MRIWILLLSSILVALSCKTSDSKVNSSQEQVAPFEISDEFRTKTFFGGKISCSNIDPEAYPKFEVEFDLVDMAYTLDPSLKWTFAQYFRSIPGVKGQFLAGTSPSSQWQEIDMESEASLTYTPYMQKNIGHIVAQFGPRIYNKVKDSPSDEVKSLPKYKLKIELHKFRSKEANMGFAELTSNANVSTEVKLKCIVPAWMPKEAGKRQPQL